MITSYAYETVTKESTSMKMREKLKMNFFMLTPPVITDSMKKTIERGEEMIGLRMILLAMMGGTTASLPILFLGLVVMGVEITIVVKLIKWAKNRNRKD